MATSSQIADLTCCAVCLETFTRPKVLPCQHTYCYSCLFSLGDEGAKTITCPQCRDVHKFPKDGISGFKDNIMANNLLGIAPREVDLCVDCKLKPAVSQCEHCDGNTCVTCMVEHIKLATELKLSLKEAKESIMTPKTDEIREKLATAKNKCCDQLEALVTVQKRKLQDLIRHANFLENFRDMIVCIYDDMLQSTDQELPDDSYFSSLSGRAHECKSADSLRDLRNDVCDLRSVVRLLQSVDAGFEFASESGGTLGSIKIGQAVVEIQGNYGADITVEQVTQMLSELGGKKLDRTMNTNLTSANLSPPEIAAASSGPGLKGSSYLVENARVLSEDHSSPNMEASSSSSYEKTCCAAARPMASSPTPPPLRREPIPAVSSLVQVYRQNQPPRNVDYHSKGKSLITIIGQGEMLDKSKRLSEPFAVAYHVAADDIYVADYGNDRIMVYKSDGSNARVFYNVFAPLDVAISTDGTYVYIAAGQGGLVKVNLNGEHVKTVRRCALGELKNCVAVACHNECTVVVDCDLQRVFVYNVADWNFRHFGGKVLVDPQYIDMREDGTMYITDNSQREVKVFTWNGKHSRVYLSSGVDYSYGLVVFDADGFAIVIAGRNKLDVYSPNMERIVSVGSRGESPGRLNGPMGLCLMPDGRLIVADCYNNRLQIF